MSDIVTRLRQWQGWPEDQTPREVMDEAAAEIERLRLTNAERTESRSAKQGPAGAAPCVTK